MQRSGPADWRHRAGGGGGGATGPAGSAAAGTPGAAPLPAAPWRAGKSAPIVGITADLVEPPPSQPGQPVRPRATVAMAYCEAVAKAGGAPVVLPPIPALAAEHARRCDAFVLTGGDDPRTELFGEPTHPKASPLVLPQRQEYETALLRLLSAPGETPAAAAHAAPVLGVCLGMQMMALVAGGSLCQHLPDEVPTAARHAGNSVHPVRAAGEAGTSHPILVLDGERGVMSSHHQAVRSPGRLRVVAVADDGVIEAVDDPTRRFYLGVQWHPERTADEALGAGLFARLVEAARVARG